MSTTTKKQNRRLVPLDATTRGGADQANERVLNAHVIGQEEARQAALDAIARARNPLRDKTRPVAIIYELGPSRTGKTLIPEMCALILHGDREAMVKINGGAYRERHQVAQLIGAPPGYLGYKGGDDEDGTRGPRQGGKVDKHAKLTQKNLDASRKGSSCDTIIVLIDEANLLHESFDDVLMSIMDKGQLDMGNNEVTNFRNCIIFLTTNLGMDEVHRKANKRSMGFTAQVDKAPVITMDDIEKTIKAALKERYRPEWLNRIDRFVIFHPHSDANLHAIVDVELELFVQRMEGQMERGAMFNIEVEESAKAFLLGSSMADNGNIANLKRELQKHLIDPLGNLLEAEKISGGDIVVITHEEGASALSFSLVWDESFECDGDKLNVVHEDEESADGLALQRRIARETRSGGKTALWDIVLECRTEKMMLRVGPGFQQELEEIYGLKVVQVGWKKVAPFAFVARVEATPGQIEAFRLKETDAKVLPAVAPAAALA